MMMMIFISHLDLKSSNANIICAPLQHVVDLIFVCVLILKNPQIPWYSRTVDEAGKIVRRQKGRRQTGFWLVLYSFVLKRFKLPL